MMSVPGVPVICADAIVVTTDPRHECVPEPEHTPQKSLSYRALVAPETTRRSDISVGRATDGNVLRGVPGMLHYYRFLLLLVLVICFTSSFTTTVA